MKNKFLSFKSLRFLVALFLLIFLLYSIGTVEILNTFRKINLSISIFVWICIIIYTIIGAFNSWIILNTLQKIPFSIFLRAYIYSWVSGLITPGQAGDVSLILFLKEHNISMKMSWVSYFADKLITLVCFFLIGWYGSYILIPELKFIWFPIVVAVILTIAASFILIRFFRRHIRRFIYKHKIRYPIRDILYNFKLLKREHKALAINILLTFVKWLTVSLCYFFAFLCFNVNTTWSNIAVIPILSTLVGYIPVSIGGIGTVELTATQLFSRVSVESSAVLSTYLLIRSIQYFLAIILLIFFRISPIFKKSD